MDGVQCPTCGHVPEEIAQRHYGTPKGRSRADREDRCAGYRDWRLGFGDGCYVADVDQVEWRIRGGVLVPVATLELTRLDGEMLHPKAYLAGTLRRRFPPEGSSEANKGHGFQTHHAVNVAKKLGVPCFVVIFKWDLTHFWVYNLSDRRGWWEMDKERYERWIRML